MDTQSMVIVTVVKLCPVSEVSHFVLIVIVIKEKTVVMIANVYIRGKKNDYQRILS